MDRIWLSHYPQHVPHDISPNTHASLAELFLETCKKYEQNVAFENFGQGLRFGDLQKRSEDLAAYFQQVLGLKQGDRIALMMPNILQYPVALFAAFRAGLTVVNVNPLYTPKELKHQLNDSGASTIVILENFAHTLAQVAGDTPLKHIIVTRMGDEMPAIKRVLMNFIVKYVKKMVPSYTLPHAINYLSAMGKGSRHTLAPVQVASEDIAFLQYTGGTTGVSKGAMLTHYNMLSNVEQAIAWIGPQMHTPDQTIVTALPLYHIFSLTANCLAHMKVGARNVLITNPRDIPCFVKMISKLKFTAFTGVNTLFNALLNDPNFEHVDFSELKLTLGGGMAVQSDVARRWHEVTGKPIIEAYGLTETSPAVCINPMDNTAYNGSIGLPISSTEVAIRNDDGEFLDIDQVGELCVRGPQVMKGYWNRPDETDKVLDAEGWLSTGDIARIDSNGYVYIVDRKKDMILISGFNVFPNEVEDVIASHPLVLEVAVVGVPDPVKGERAKAFVIQNGNSLTQDVLIEFCKKSLTSYKVPKEFVFVESLPKSNVGKILRRELRSNSV